MRLHERLLYTTPSKGAGDAGSSSPRDDQRRTQQDTAKQSQEATPTPAVNQQEQELSEVALETEEPGPLRGVQQASEVGASQTVEQRLVEQLRDAVKAGRLLAAQDVARQLAALLQIPDPSELLTRLKGSPSAAALENLNLDLVLSEAEAVEAALALLHNHEGFHQVSGQSGGALQGWYRQCQSGRVHWMKFAACVPGVTTEQLLSCVREFDLITHWNRYCTRAAVLHEASCCSLWVYGAAWLPMPFKEPDSLLRIQGWDLFQEHGCYALTVRSEEAEALPQEARELLPGDRDTRKHVEVRSATMFFKPLPPGPDGRPRTLGTVVAEMDPHLPSVPSWLVEFVAKVMAPFLYRALEDRMQSAFADDSSEFSKRLGTRPLYQQVRESAEQVLQQQKGGQKYALDRIFVGDVSASSEGLAAEADEATAAAMAAGALFLEPPLAVAQGVTSFIKGLFT